MSKYITDASRVVDIFAQLHNGEVVQLGVPPSEANSVCAFWQLLISSMAELAEEKCEATWHAQWSEVARRWRAVGKPLFRPDEAPHTHDKFLSFNVERCACTWVSRNAQLLPCIRAHTPEFAAFKAQLSCEVEECVCKLYASATKCSPRYDYIPSMNASSIQAFLRHAPEMMQVRHSFLKVEGYMPLGRYLIVETAGVLVDIERRALRRSVEERKEDRRVDEEEEAAMVLTDPATRETAESTLDLLLDLLLPQCPTYISDLERHHFGERDKEMMIILKEVVRRRDAWAGRAFWVQACISIGLLADDGDISTPVVTPAFKKSRMGGCSQ
jgi:hypothetical protein